MPFLLWHFFLGDKTENCCGAISRGLLGNFYA